MHAVIYLLRYTDVSYLVTSPHVQRAVRYERRVAAPLQPAHRGGSLGGSHPGELAASNKNN